MNIVVVCNVGDKKFRRVFPCPRDPTSLLPQPPSMVYSYINDLLSDYKFTDFSVTLAFRHDLSVPDLFDKFNCKEYKIDE